MTGDELLQEAAAVVRDRCRSYGDPTDLFERVAARGPQVIGTKITPAQVGLCLAMIPDISTAWSRSRAPPRACRS